MISRVIDGKVKNFTQKMFTRFQELPRWIIHSSMVYSLNIGRSDALRFNFVHVYGQNAANGIVNSMPYQIVNNNPVRDDLDIERNGLRPYMTTVPCGFKDVKFGPKAWMEIISDIVMNQNLVLQGSIELIGVDLPISEGDNIEYDGIIYHIDAYQHSCRISSDGQKMFKTVLTLSHGVPARNNLTLNQSTKEFAGVNSPYQNTNLPAVSVEDTFPTMIGKGG
jgi:hypothetical protein